MFDRVLYKNTKRESFAILISDHEHYPEIISNNYQYENKSLYFCEYEFALYTHTRNCAARLARLSSSRAVHFLRMCFASQNVSFACSNEWTISMRQTNYLNNRIPRLCDQHLNCKMYFKVCPDHSENGHIMLRWHGNRYRHMSTFFASWFLFPYNLLQKTNKASYCGNMFQWLSLLLLLLRQEKLQIRIFFQCRWMNYCIIQKCVSINYISYH